MTTNEDPCGCCDSKAWEARAIRAEADLALAKNLLRRVSAQIGDLINVLPPEEMLVSTPEDPIAGFTTAERSGLNPVQESHSWEDFAVRVSDLARAEATKEQR